LEIADSKRNDLWWKEYESLPGTCEAPPDQGERPCRAFGGNNVGFAIRNLNPNPTSASIIVFLTPIFSSTI
jgi:hypothetical protein